MHQVQSHLEIVSLENLKIILKHANIAMKRQALGQTGVPSKDKFVGKMKLVHVMIALTNQEYFTTSKKKSLGPAQLAIQMVPGNITALTTHTAPNQEMENAIPSKALFLQMREHVTLPTQRMTMMNFLAPPVNMMNHQKQESGFQFAIHP